MKNEQSSIWTRSRPILIGLLLIPVNIYWLTVVEVRWYSLDGSCLPLFVEPIFILFIIALLNLAVAKFAPGSSLTQGELLCIYIMLTASVAIAGHDMIQNLFGLIAHPFQFATPENEWEELFFRHIPGWLTVDDKDILRGYYEGNSTLYTARHIKAWLVPLASWGVLIFILIFMMLCINVIIRKRWTEDEKLAYPIIQLPLAMTRQSIANNLFFGKLLWVGFAVAAIIDIINGLHYLYPSVPEIPVKSINLRRFFTEKPWNAIGWTPLRFYPLAMGIAFFLPLDLSFSCWFFYLFRKAENILGSLIGWRSLPGFPYFNEQAFGAWMGLCFIAAWASRSHLREVFFRAFGRKSSLDDAKEPIRYRTALLGIILGMLFLVFFSSKAGMEIWVIPIFFFIYFSLAIAITRVRAELGTPHEIYFIRPHEVMAAVFGTRSLNPSSLTILSYYWWFTRCNRCHPMPTQLEALKMAESARISGKRVLFAILLGTVFSFLVASWANLAILYKNGAAVSVRGFHAFTGWGAFDPLQRWLANPTNIDTPGVSFMGIGLISVFSLMAMRMRFFWWPLHPAGYALAVSFAMDLVWFAFLISWAIKLVILRYGGIKVHRRAIPFFLGLILGDYVIGSIWSIIGAIVGIPTYKIYE
jgi:hypothetical protein